MGEAAADSPLQMAVARLARVITAIERGQPLALDDGEFVVHALRRSIFEKIPLTNSLGLLRGWETLMRDAELRAAIQMPPDQHVRAAARALQSKLINYRARSFALDKARRPPDRVNQTFFSFLESRGGKVPSFGWLRAFLTGQKNGVSSGHDMEDVESNEVNNGEEFDGNGSAD
jgi:hypothetical protein